MSTSLRQFLSAKLHRGTVTLCDLNYEGSCGLGPDLLKASGILPYEKVSVLNIATGHRLETYAIPAQTPGEISLNGAAARYATAGDKVIILVFAVVPEDRVAAHEVRIVVLGEGNKILSTRTERPVAP
ncbi:aspartate 1-decarboxylase [bacterium]|nr:aspartate 1-decarboxylase [bacterium]